MYRTTHSLQSNDDRPVFLLYLLHNNFKTWSFLCHMIFIAIRIDEQT